VAVDISLICSLPRFSATVTLISQLDICSGCECVSALLSFLLNPTKVQSHTKIRLRSWQRGGRDRAEIERTKANSWSLAAGLCGASSSSHSQSGVPSGSRSVCCLDPAGNDSAWSQATCHRHLPWILQREASATSREYFTERHLLWCCVLRWCSFWFVLYARIKRGTEQIIFLSYFQRCTLKT
jgi:hypothetical protein